MIILRPKNIIFEGFWPLSKFHFTACSTLSMNQLNCQVKNKWSNQPFTRIALEQIINLNLIKGYTRSDPVNQVDPGDHTIEITPDDTRYTPETAEYWRSLGLTIVESQIRESGPAVTTSEIKANAVTNKHHWMTDPINVDGERRWRIRYGFGWGKKKLSEEYQDEVRKSLKLMEDEVCFTFVEVTSLDEEHLGIIKYFNGGGGGCWSHVGLTPGYDNWVSIGKGCQDISTIQHETMHTLGTGVNIK